MKKTLILLVIAMSIYGCGKKKGIIIKGDVKIYKIESFEEIFLQWNDLVDTVEIIPLETTEESLIGQLTKGIIDKEDIFIFDYKLQCLVNFDITGNFIRKIGEKGMGPEDFLEIRDICLSGDNVYALDFKKIHCYDRNTGRHRESWSLHDKNEFNPSNFFVYDKEHYFLWCSNPDIWNRNKGEYYRMKEIVKGEIRAEYFKYEYPTSDDPRFYSCRQDSYYLKPIDGEYIVHRYTNDTLYASFSIDFGEYAISPKKIDELRNSKERNAYYKSPYYKSISNILETDDYIYFSCIGPKSKSYEGIINKETDEIKFGKWDYKKSPHFFYTDGISLYGYYEPYVLLDKKNNGSHLNTCFDMIFDHLENIDISDNIILVKVFLKAI
jgi:hypothetical protein